MNNNSSLETMHAFWLAQRNIAKMQEDMSNVRDLRSRNDLEALLKAEKLKLAAIP